MPIVVIALVLTVFLAITESRNVEHTNKRAQASEAQSFGSNLLVYRDAVLQYARTNPGFSGPVPDNALNLPTWYRKADSLLSFASGGRGYVYILNPPSGLLAELVGRASTSAFVGVARGGQIRHPTRGDTAIPVPPAIPEGSLVYAG